jgi:hypothetical protein
MQQESEVAQVQIFHLCKKAISKNLAGSGSLFWSGG